MDHRILSSETETDFVTAIEGGTVEEIAALMESKAKAQAWWKEGMTV
jgi:hypothetical protein